MRSLAGFRDSLSFRTEKEATHLGFCAKGECTFPGEILSQPLEHPPAFSPFHINISLKSQLP